MNDSLLSQHQLKGYFFDLQEEVLVGLRNVLSTVNTGSYGYELCSENTHGVTPIRLNLSVSGTLHEHDVVVFDLSHLVSKSVISEDRITGISEEQEFLHPGYRNLNLRPAAGVQLNPLIDRALQGGTIVVVLLGTIKEEKYCLSKLDHSAYLTDFAVTKQLILNDLAFLSAPPKVTNIRGNEINMEELESIPDKFHALARLLKEHSEEAEYFCTIESNPRIIPMALNRSLDVVAFVEEYEGGGLLLGLPQPKDKAEFLEQMFKTALPEMAPHLFPHYEVKHWQDQIVLFGEEELNSRQKIAEEEYKEKLAAIELDRNKIREEYGFLADLLTKHSTELETTIETFLNFLEFDSVVNIDDLKLKETKEEGKSESSILWEEDFHIELGDKLAVVEVKGLGGTTSDGQWGQVLKYKQRQAKNLDCYVYGVYIVNHERHKPPQARKFNPFTENQIKDAEGYDVGLLTTLQLFNLYKSIKFGGLGKGEARERFFEAGFIEFKPTNSSKLPPIIKLWKEGLVPGMTLDGTRVRKGDEITVELDGVFTPNEVVSLSQGGKEVEEASTGDTGLRLKHPVKRQSEIWVRHGSEQT